MTKVKRFKAKQNEFTAVSVPDWVQTSTSLDHTSLFINFCS